MIEIDTIMIKNISKDKILKDAYDLSFPRRVGSEGNLKARELLFSKITELEYIPHFQTFTYSYLFRSFIFNIIRIIYILGIIGLLILYFPFTQERIIWILIPGTLIIVLLLIEFSYYQEISQFSLINWEKFKQKKLIRNGKNIFTIKSNESRLIFSDELNEFQLTFEKKNKNKRHIIILSAHYDSINVSYGPFLIIFTSIFNTIGILIIGFFPIVLLILQGIWYYTFMIIYLIFCSLTILSLFLRLFRKLQNFSDGAIDNASGVSTVLGVARALKDRDLPNVDIIFSFWDAEEEGLVGSLSFVEKHLQKLINLYCIEKIHVISYDGCGSKGKISFGRSFGFPRVIKHDKGIVNKLKASAESLGIPTKTSWFYYPPSDHACFGIRNIDSVWFYSFAAVSNTVKDKKELLIGQTLANSVKISIQYLSSF
ncbi:hypothetical protein ES706_06425 [subsurface metagenome]